MTVDALLRRTEEPLHGVRPEGEAQLSGVRGRHQEVVTAYDGYRLKLDERLQEDALLASNSMAEVRQAARQTQRQRPGLWGPGL